MAILAINDISELCHLKHVDKFPVDRDVSGGKKVMHQPFACHVIKNTLIVQQAFLKMLIVKYAETFEEPEEEDSEEGEGDVSSGRIYRRMHMFQLVACFCWRRCR